MNYLKDIGSSIISSIVEAGNYRSKPLLSVIVVTYGNRKLLLENLNALRKQTYRNFEVILIDNNDKLVITDIIDKHENRYIKLKKNYGLCVGRNVGIINAKGEILIFLDDDALPANNFIEEHYKAHSNYNIYGLRGKCLPRTNSIYNCMSSHYDLGNDIMNYCINLEGNASFKKDILMEIGGFNISLGGAGGYEGLELSYRIAKQYADPSKLIYYPNAVIYHDFSNSYTKYFRKQLRHKKNEELIFNSYPELKEYIYKLEKEHIYSKSNSINDFKSKVINKITALLIKIYT